MSLRHAIRRGGGVIASSSARKVARGGGGPSMPPFARNKPVDYQVNAYFLAVLYLLQEMIVVFLSLLSSVPSRAMFAVAIQAAWVTHTARFSTQHICLSLPDAWRLCGCAVFPLLNEAYGTCPSYCVFFCACDSYCTYPSRFRASLSSTTHRSVHNLTPCLSCSGATRTRTMYKYLPFVPL